MEFNRLLSLTISNYGQPDLAGNKKMKILMKNKKVLIKKLFFN